MEDTSGFYKVDMSSGGLAFAPNFVASPTIYLVRSDPESMEGEHEGWKWFENDTAAYVYFGLTPGNVPWLISPLQAKIALNRMGMLDMVQSMIAGSDVETRLAWEEAISFERSSPLLNQLAGALGMTSAQLDDIFSLASSIKV